MKRFYFYYYLYLIFLILLLLPYCSSSHQIEIKVLYNPPEPRPFCDYFLGVIKIKISTEETEEIRKEVLLYPKKEEHEEHYEGRIKIKIKKTKGEELYKIYVYVIDPHFSTKYYTGEYVHVEIISLPPAKIIERKVVENEMGEFLLIILGS